jgi:hypothetical protein|tara:strand:- start:488 stop:1114 length:627 start_codon:yes stop_codon:yes gene_type:complete
MRQEDQTFKEGMMGLFAVPIILKHAKGEQFNKIQEELLGVANSVDFSQVNGWSHDTHMLSPDPFNSNIVVDNKCSNFLDFLEDTLTEYIETITGEVEFGYEIQESWFTKTLKGKYAHEHHHGYADISGVYYINTNQEDGNLVFDNIHSQMAGNYVFANLPGKQPMPLQNGLLILWPGPIKHGTWENRTDNERMSLSFNIFMGRKGYRI